MSLEYKKQTDKEHKETLESKVLHAVWCSPVATAGSPLEFEVGTQFVGNDSDIVIEVKDRRSIMIKSITGKVFGNLFGGTFIIPTSAKEELTFTVKLPKHGIEKKSETIRIIPPLKVTNMKWSRKEVREGEIVKLSADVNLPDDSEVKLFIYEYDQDGAHDSITKMPCTVKSNKVESEWAFEYHEDMDDILTKEEKEKYGGTYNPPEYFFVIDHMGRRFGDKQESRLLKFTPLPKIGILLSFHPVLFKKLEYLDNTTKFYPLRDALFSTHEMLADGESEAIIQVHLAKLDKKGQVGGKQVQLAKSDHSNEGVIVLELDSEEFGKLRYGSQKGSCVEVPVRDMTDGESSLEKAKAILFVTSREIGGTTLSAKMIENKSYEYIKTFELPITTKWSRDLKVGSRSFGVDTKGYDALKVQWFLRSFGILSHKERTVGAKTADSEWTNIKDIVLDGDFGSTSVRCLRDFQRVSRGRFRNQTRNQVPVTFTDPVSATITKSIISEFLVWRQNGYQVDAYHGRIWINHSDGGAINADAQILYNALLVNDDPKGYLGIANPIGHTLCQWDNRQIMIAESIRSAIRLFRRDALAFRLHDADPSGKLDDSNMHSGFKNNVIATLRTLRKEQVAADMGASARNVRIHAGFRTVAEQDAIYAKGRTVAGEPCTHNNQSYASGACPIPNGQPGHHSLGKMVTDANGTQMKSWHMFGLAVDLVFCDKGGSFNWGDDKNWNHNGTVGKANGLTWGGDWVSADRPHFQLPTADAPSQAIKNAYNNTPGTVLQKLQAAWALV